MLNEKILESSLQKATHEANKQQKEYMETIEEKSEKEINAKKHGFNI